ncbi:MAG: PorP/SprF family type IX secretion system membrane protein, partial [Bacteroidota bacterium]
NQWIGPSSPYTTGTISFDSKLFQNVAGNYVDENTRVGIGGMMMYDQAMEGVLKSNYASFNASGNIRIKEGRSLELNGARIRHNSKIKMDEGAEHRLGIGLGVIYGHKRVDYSKLTFGEQFTGFGFDTNLPTGEAALSSMKGYISTSAGILYSYINENSNLDIGVAAFHFNKPMLTALNDENQYLATRYVIHGNYETFVASNVILNTNGIYQYQSGASYFSVGGALGYYLPNDNQDIILNAGLWYWSKNAVIPYLGFAYGNFQVGLTYDVTISDLKQSPRKPKTFELCLIIRGNSKPNGIIPSPWK